MRRGSFQPANGPPRRKVLTCRYQPNNQTQTGSRKDWARVAIHKLGHEHRRRLHHRLPKRPYIVLLSTSPNGELFFEAAVLAAQETGPLSPASDFNRYPIGPRPISTKPQNNRLQPCRFSRSRYPKRLRTTTRSITIATMIPHGADPDLGGPRRRLTAPSGYSSRLENDYSKRPCLR